MCGSGFGLFVNTVITLNEFLVMAVDWLVLGACLALLSASVTYLFRHYVDGRVELMRSEQRDVWIRTNPELFKKLQSEEVYIEELLNMPHMVCFPEFKEFCQVSVVISVGCTGCLALLKEIAEYAPVYRISVLVYFKPTQKEVNYGAMLLMSLKELIRAYSSPLLLNHEDNKYCEEWQESNLSSKFLGTPSVVINNSVLTGVYSFADIGNHLT